MRITIFGLGYVGCVTAGCLAQDGHEIIGVDILADKVRQLSMGNPTVGERGLKALIQEGFKNGRISATMNAAEALAKSDVSIICVGTPSQRNGNLQVESVFDTWRMIVEHLPPGREHLVILRSTLPSGTASALLKEKRDRKLSIAVVPEFLREGSAISDYYAPPMIAVGTRSGAPDQTEPILQELFAESKGQWLWMRFEEAELLKAVCNVFHALKVSFANEIGALSSLLGVNGHKLMRSLTEDRKLNISPAYLTPGLPFGGSCLPKDLRMICHLASSHHCELPLLGSISRSNEAQLSRAIAAIDDLGVRTIGLEGLAFKSGTDDMRESPQMAIAEYLIGKGYDLKIYDPDVQSADLVGANREFVRVHLPHLFERIVPEPADLLTHCEAVIITRAESAVLRLASASGFDAVKFVDLTRPAFVCQQSQFRTRDALAA
jgi:GDP-mannose 6-dehydrogenase